MDDKSKQDGRDDAKVDLNDPNEVSYADQQANVSTKNIRNVRKLQVHQTGKNSPVH
ncbi:hypothetical protein [Pedobacter agri]|uniref:Uncharacterized protein n=1 Tax=Pedobacter agri TaxID=454586 RepID=A0A9X3IBH1_9SPHI|nr:hypothetical protein [Pedobacter agri]MCX3267415.1 hypothetical protein [Pedobacter agri]